MDSSLQTCQTHTDTQRTLVGDVRRSSPSRGRLPAACSAGTSNHWHCDTGHGRAIPHTESAKTCVHVAARWEVGRPSKELSPPQTRVPKRKTNRNPARPWTLACSAPTPQTTVPESGAGGGWNVGPEPESTDIRCSKTSRSTANIDSSDLRSQCGGLSGLHCVPTA